MTQLLRRIWYLLNRRRLEKEMAEEMAYHRELMSSDRRPEFGRDLHFREDAREIWGWAWLDRLRQDASYGARVLRKSPGFTGTAMLILALGIGVPLTAFRQVISDLQTSSAPDPDTLVHITRRSPTAHITAISYPAMAFYAANSTSFRSVIGVSENNRVVFGDAREEINLAFATSNYFREFGIMPLRGRLLTTSDERRDAELVALLGELFWQHRLGGDQAAIGRMMRLNGTLVRIVGILPVSAAKRSDVWMPLTQQPMVIAGSTLLEDWGSSLDVYARLNPGVSPKAAEQETRSLAERLRELRPNEVLRDEYLEARPILQFENHSNEFQILLTAAALVMLLLIAACANLGTLVLARGITRGREIGTRMALGAGRNRIVRQLFTESLILAALGGLCALFFSSLVLKFIQLQHNPDASIFPDWRALGITSAIAVIAAVVFGLPPALRLTSAAPHGGRARAIFLTVQVTVSCLLMVVSSLMVSNLYRLSVNDPGFDYRHLLVVSPDLKTHGYGAPAASAYFDSLGTAVAALPGVKASSQIWLAPWGNIHAGNQWQGRSFAANHVDSHFFNTMGMHLVRGRNFQPGEHGVAIISEATAHVLWPDQEPLGKALPWEAQHTAVVGIVRNASTTEVSNPQPLEYYLPPSQADAPVSALLVRFSGEPADSVRRLKELVRNVDPRLQSSVQLLADAYNLEVERASRALGVVTVLGAVAMLLSAIGLAGLAGYTVARQKREIAVRLALGAKTVDVIGAMLAPMNRPIVVGFFCGALGASAVAKVIQSGIPAMAGVRIFDPIAYLMAMVFFCAVVALAVLAPGRRALRINPAKALHEVG